MEVTPQIDFQGLPPSESTREAIAAHVAGLENRFGRLTSCRVVLKGPGGHHHTSGLYEINVRLGLPDGREVNIARTPNRDIRHGDLNFAINDAFKRARRRLQDNVRRMQGQVKTHEVQPVGTVTLLNPERGFGFLTTADGREIYFHQNAVLNDGFSRLAVGVRVAFAEEMGDRGPQASTVRTLGK
jgi:cold shock CspA family protein